jgi:1-acyl-sn-glycerol-3-phosphate acyltransferase
MVYINSVQTVFSLNFIKICRSNTNLSVQTTAAMRFFWKLYFRISGWKITQPFPINLPKAVIIVAPHTSAMDFPIGLAVRSILNLQHTHFLGKEELFKGTFGFFFRLMGGYPVNRFSKLNMVDQVVEIFNQHTHFLLALSPEGTRKKVDRLRTGFYHIAQKANVPIIMVGFDFAIKEISIAEPFYTGNDESADFKKIIQFFAPIQGKNPHLGIAHLLTD